MNQQLQQLAHAVQQDAPTVWGACVQAVWAEIAVGAMGFVILIAVAIVAYKVGRRTLAKCLAAKAAPQGCTDGDGWGATSIIAFVLSVGAASWGLACLVTTVQVALSFEYQAISNLTALLPNL